MIDAKGRNPEDRIRVIIQTKEPDSGVMSCCADVVDEMHVHKLTRYVSGKVRAGDLEKLSQMSDVVEIFEDLPVHAMLSDAIPLQNVPGAWAKGFKGKNIKVAVIDTGINSKHPALVGRVIEKKNFASSGDIEDGHGHGSHVAGIIGGNEAGSSYIGMAPECLFINAKVLDDSGSGYLSGVMRGIEWAVDVGAHVMNLSLGADTNGDGTDALSKTCDAAMDAGCVVCVAAGNAGPGRNTVGIPGVAKKVITVGATDKKDQIASFSSRGPTADGRTKPDLCAVGVSVMSVNRNGGYRAMSGTSMATPMVAGLVALLLSAKKGMPQQIKDVIMSTTKKIGSDPNTYGTGRIDALAALNQYLGEPPPPPPPPPKQYIAEDINGVGHWLDGIGSQQQLMYLIDLFKEWITEGFAYVKFSVWSFLATADQKYQAAYDCIKRWGKLPYIDSYEDYAREYKKLQDGTKWYRVACIHRYDYTGKAVAVRGFRYPGWKTHEIVNRVAFEQAYEDIFGEKP